MLVTPMIIWLASYPKSGNTWVRSFLSSYYYTKDGSFNFDLLKNINQYPNKEFFDQKITYPGEIHKYWHTSQEKIIKKNKNIFLKTHNSLLALNNFNFTSQKYTKGVIYIIRDPRNILTSLKNHYSLSYNEALEFMTSDKKYIYDDRNECKNDYSTFHFLSSWANHYKSWTKNNLFPKLIIKYEDLITNPDRTFKKIINFVNDTFQLDHQFNEVKFQNAIFNTSFKKLQSLEKQNKFTENVYSKENSKIKFFDLGPNNNWDKQLNDEIKKKANELFNDDIKYLNYV